MSLLQVLFFLLAILRSAGVDVGGVMLIRSEGEVHSCRGFCSVPGPLQSVQRAEMWSVILALQSCSAVHLVVDNMVWFVMLGVCLMVIMVLFPLSLSRDGDLPLLFW